MLPRSRHTVAVNGLSRDRAVKLPPPIRQLIATVDDQPSELTPSLPPAEYHLIVAPVLQVTADIAAARGDPDLFNDMPSMLALMALVRALADCYRRDAPEKAEAVRDALKAAPMGACLMALHRSELDESQINDCTWALEKATTQLVEAGVLGRERPLAEEAYRLLTGNDRAGAIERLKGAATGIVMEIDRWERTR